MPWLARTRRKKSKSDSFRWYMKGSGGYSLSAVRHRISDEVIPVIASSVSTISITVFP